LRCILIWGGVVPGNLAGLTDRQLAELFRERGLEATVLDALNEELKKRYSDEALDLHLEVVARRKSMQLTSRPAVRPQKTGPVREWVRGMLTRRGLLRPDGRPLYRYRLTDAEYEDAKQVLGQLARAGRLEHPDQTAGVLFVAYCAEWFRRESQSTFLRWDEIDPGLFPKVPYQSKQKLTLAGLRYWGRKLRVRPGTRQFLLTLALEGGIPVRVVVDGGEGWLREYLRAILRQAVNGRASSAEQFLAIARDERGRMARRYDHDDFVELCAEFALIILTLRQGAEAAKVVGVPNSAILNATHPGWQDELPIHVPAENEALARQLLTGLLDEKLSGPVTRGIEAHRYLVRRDGEWVPALQLLADGEIAVGRLPELPTEERARAVAAGHLAEYIPGEIALLEPPSERSKTWRMRPTARSSRMMHGFPLDAPVSAILTTPSSAPVSWNWPGGDPRHSDVLIFEADEPNGSERVLRLVRSGSAGLPAKSLHVLIRPDWEIQCTDSTQIVSDELLAHLDRRLIEVTGTVYLRAPGETARYRVATDSQSQSAALELPFFLAGWRPAEPDEEMATSPLVPLVREGTTVRSPKPRELYYRRPGGRWIELTGSGLAGEGPFDVSLRDPSADIQIERTRVVLVPSGARIEARMTDTLVGELRLVGMSGWSISGPDLQPTEDAQLFAIQFDRVPNQQLNATLHSASGVSFEVIVPVTGRDAVVALSWGAIIPPGAKVDISALRGAVIVAPARTRLEVAPKGARSGGFNVTVDGGMPMGVLRSAIREALASLNEQDEQLELAFLGDTRLPIRITRFRVPMLAWNNGEVIWRSTPATLTSKLVARMILDPRHEHALTQTADGRWRLPDWCEGPCLVYLRDGPDVVSRPRIVTGAPVSTPANALQRALTTADYDQRQAAIKKELEIIGAGGLDAAASTKWLTEAVVHLRGLPPNSIDALRLLPEHPQAAIAMLVNAADADRAAVWALQEELPLLWLAMRATAWEPAIQSYRLTLFDALSRNLPANAIDAAKVANEQTDRLRDALIEMEPALASVCGNSAQRLRLFKSLPPLNALTSHYIASHHDRNRDDRNHLGERLVSLGLKLPVEIASKAHDMFAGLFAPVLLAAAAASKMKPAQEDMLLIRHVLREDPTYITGAWPYFLKHFGAFGK
jgi:hypothetical protein